ncbi:MAG: ATP synthase subunit I [Acidimicrobiaceae bacterium]|nr:ATP synthase subunit I [Acidimicrobiaceae bacterium]MCY4175481.1 ATP synthase subunit I [Acidimicrobiaceae bacterium]MCY4280715.1 ATP synthase subunit I [Acidimicrobiaceae bacterium]MCY4294170.1 ATP synthase subunit I [Acidimicrobiaceae bacterium]
MESPAEAQSAAPEQDVARDMLRRSVFFAAPLLAAGALGWGWAGTLSAGLALALVLVNFVLGAAAIRWGARSGSAGLMAAVMGGYVLRLAIVTAAVLPIRHHDWFELLPFAVSLLVTHLGLLIVETRHVSATPAFPGLKPRLGGSSGTGATKPEATKPRSNGVTP